MNDDVFIMSLDEDEDFFTKNPIPHPLRLKDPARLRKDLLESVTSERLRILANYLSTESLHPQILVQICESLDAEYVSKAIVLGHHIGLSKIGILTSSDTKIQDQVFIHCKIIGCIMTSVSAEAFNDKGYLTGKWLLALESLPGPMAGIEFQKNTCRVIDRREETEVYPLLQEIIWDWGRSHVEKWHTNLKSISEKSIYNVYYIEPNQEADS